MNSNAEQLIRLLDAGFTKDEIIKIIQPETAFNDTANKAPEEKAAAEQVPAEAAAPASEAPAQEAPAQPVGPDPLDEIKSQIAAITDTLGTISKAMINPTLADIKPLGIDDIITKFFKEE